MKLHREVLMATIGGGCTGADQPPPLGEPDKFSDGRTWQALSYASPHTG